MVYQIHSGNNHTYLVQDISSVRDLSFIVGFLTHKENLLVFFEQHPVAQEGKFDDKY